MERPAPPAAGPPAPVLHATLIARRVGGRWAGALLQGPSGAGKSELALRALATGWRLAADDRTAVWVSGGRLFGRAPPPLAGLLEVRSLQHLAVAPLPFAPIVLLARAQAAGAAPPRLAGLGAEVLAGAPVAAFTLDLRQAGSLAQLAAALDLAVREAGLTAHPATLSSALAGAAGPRPTGSGPGRQGKA